MKIYQIKHNEEGHAQSIIGWELFSDLEKAKERALWIYRNWHFAYNITIHEFDTDKISNDNKFIIIQCYDIIPNHYELVSPTIEARYDYKK